MTDDLQALEDWIQPLIARLSPAQRRTLTRQVALDLRRANRERIKAQQNPDGTPFEPRKNRLRTQTGSIRRRGMFAKIRTAKYLKMKGTPNGAEVGFTGRVARIARVHHKGLRDQVEPGGPSYDYPERHIVGFARDDRERIRDSLLAHLSEH